MYHAQAYEAWFATPFGRRADRVERRILGDLLAAFGGATSLLDVGSGTGHFASLWADPGLRAVGVDLDLDRLRYSRRARPDFPVALADATRLPFRDGSFDVVALVTVLEFLAHPLEALREAARVARRGVLLGVLSSASPVAWWRRLRRSRAYREARFYSPWGLERFVGGGLTGRPLAISARTGLYPAPWQAGATRLPFGAFIGMGVRFL